MKFGVFDHIDQGGLPSAGSSRSACALIESYEHAGFYSYHLAEHHATPLGRRPSPSSSSPPPPSARRRCASGPASTACRSITRCGSSRRSACSTTSATGGCSSASAAGVSPVEIGFFDLDWETGERFDESFEILLQGLTCDELTHHGARYDSTRPMMLRPFQGPHPPLWYGSRTPGAPTGRPTTRQRRRPAPRRRWSGRSPTPIGPSGRRADAPRRTSRSWASRGSSSWPRPTTRP